MYLFDVDKKLFLHNFLYERITIINKSIDHKIIWCLIRELVKQNVSITTSGGPSTQNISVSVFSLHLYTNGLACYQHADYALGRRFVYTLNKLLTTCDMLKMNNSYWDIYRLGRSIKNSWKCSIMQIITNTKFVSGFQHGQNSVINGSYSFKVITIIWLDDTIWS